MNTQSITTSKVNELVNELATTAIVGVAITIVSGIFAYRYLVDAMSFTQEFSAFGLGW